MMHNRGTAGAKLRLHPAMAGYGIGPFIVYVIGDMYYVASRYVG